ncbi:Kinesin-like motor protein 9 [Escovopsis weberi]|uniref:Kinesin-like protein n=1 Tax=Escovopsis weberi TaxID=150374 RepID=A0A0M9VWT8_ESCWE|nr:Kinesin-like motor protein 9 [Escovopsis weberi]
MDSPVKVHHLFEVFLRLRPPPLDAPQLEPILHLEEPDDNRPPTHITLNPPVDRRRTTDKFAFTQVFREEASQLDVFDGTEIASLVEGVLAPQGGEGTDAVVASLGVTGSGKTHTILGSRSQRGMTQLALNVLFRGIGDHMIESCSASVLESLQNVDSSEAVLIAAPHFLDGPDPDFSQSVRSNSWAPSSLFRCPIRNDQIPPALARSKTAAGHPSPLKRAKEKPFMSLTAASRLRTTAKHESKGDFSMLSASGMRPNLPHPSSLPRIPDVSDVRISCDRAAEHVIIVSMYEVHNDRIYDLLTPTSKFVATKEFRRRPLLYKSTELSPDRKVVAGLCKIVCMDLEEVLLVLEAGLQQRRVTSTSSNIVSSRSHGFFCFEVKKRTNVKNVESWSGSKLTIVDLAGSERAKETKAHGATLAEAGKINESLMYLGQCLQAQSEAQNSGRPNVIPYRQCKLTELLFSNSFPSQSTAAFPNVPRRNPQKGLMIVTADPLGDFASTSQILRYGALAREITTPRVASIASAIYSDQSAASDRSFSPPPERHQEEEEQEQRLQAQKSTYFFQAQFRPFNPPASVTIRKRPPPKATDERTTMELAALEIARLSDEIEQLREEVEQLRDEAEVQAEARIAAEAHLVTLEEGMEDRMLEMEANVREDCAIEYEHRLALEISRFKNSMQLEKERNEEHWDRKVDLLQNGLGLDEDEDEDEDMDADDYDKENILIEDLQQEVERLRRENGVMRRELLGRSPTKRKPLEERDDFAVVPGGKKVSGQDNVLSLGRKMERMHITNSDASLRSLNARTSPKKMRKLGKRWEDMQCDD